MYFRECNDTSLTVYSTVALCKSFNHEDVLAHCVVIGGAFISLTRILEDVEIYSLPSATMKKIIYRR